jgi:site-specific recombinase XerD
MGQVNDLATLAISWRRALRAQNKSPRTIVGYLEGVRLFEDFLAQGGSNLGADEIRRAEVEAFIAKQLERWTPATARTRYRSLQQFFRFLMDESVCTISPMLNMKPPAVPESPPPVLTDDELRRLLRVCEGKRFVDRRDQAIIRLLLDTGMRLAELAALTVDDLDLEQDLAVVLGKGRRPRACPFGARTGAALDRYVRARATHSAAAGARLWLGRGGAMTPSGIRQIVANRARQAGLSDVHPHRFRHTFAHRWLSEGGQETDLMRLAGWRSRAMLSRYGASAADTRARAAHHRLALGERI